MFKFMSSRVAVIAIAATAAIFTLSSTVQAQHMYWKKQNVEIKFQGVSNTSTFNGIFQKVLSTPVAYECGYNQEPQVEVRPGTCYETICHGGAGRSPQWDAFYGAKKAEKASKLAAAIRGVGKSSAEALVSNGYFSSKPRSWQAFKTEISTAASSGVISEQVKTLVLSTYRQDNMSNLGYASGSCESRPYSCDEVVVVREGGYVQQTCFENVEQVIEDKAMNYTFNVNGAVLLPTENETVTVTLTGEPAELTVRDGNYNNYAAQVAQNSGHTAMVNLQGVGRKQVDLPAAGLQSVTLMPAQKTQATLQIAVSDAILPATSSETLVLSYKVKACKIGWFNSCGFGWDKVDNYVGKITAPMTYVGAPITITAGQNGLKMEVEVSVYKQNSIYHNPRPISKTTERIVLK